MLSSPYYLCCAIYMHVTMLPPLCARHLWTMRALQHSTYAIKGKQFKQCKHSERRKQRSASKQQNTVRNTAHKRDNQSHRICHATNTCKQKGLQTLPVPRETPECHLERRAYNLKYAFRETPERHLDRQTYRLKRASRETPECHLERRA